MKATDPRVKTSPSIAHAILYDGICMMRSWNKHNVKTWKATEEQGSEFHPLGGCQILKQLRWWRSARVELSWISLSPPVLPRVLSCPVSILFRTVSSRFATKLRHKLSERIRKEFI